MKLILPIKKQWFDEIAQGTKPEEYRELNAYYLRRLFYSGKVEFSKLNCEHIIWDLKNIKDTNRVFDKWQLVPKINNIEFRNGYGSKVPSFSNYVRNIKISTGKVKYGAIKDKLYFVIELTSGMKWINKTPEQQLYEDEANANAIIMIHQKVLTVTKCVIIVVLIYEN